MEESFKIEISKQIGTVEAKAEAANKRVDEMNREIKEVLKDVQGELKKLNEHMVRSENHGPQIEILMSAHNQQKGAKATLIVVGSLLGSLITAGIGYILK